MEKLKNSIECPICQGRSAKFFSRKNGFNLYKCQNCKLIFIFPILKSAPDIYEHGYFYDSKGDFGYADYEGDKEVLLENFKKYIGKLEKYSSQKGKLLDVGSATGVFVELADKRGWDASGIEISQDASEIGRRKDLKIITGEFDNYNFSEDSFDAITLWDVLEHFVDPGSALHKAQKILKKGGLLAINTPDSASIPARILGSRWHLIVPPEHLSYFNLKNLEIILKKNNLEILYSGRVGKNFSLRYIFKTLSRWHNFFLWKKIYSYLSGSRLGKLNITLNTRDNMFIIARKS